MPRKFEYYSRTKRPKLSYPELKGKWIDYEIKQVKHSTGPGEDDFTIEEKVIEHETDIKEFVNSFKDEVGVRNILKKVAKTGDPTLLQQGEAMYADLSAIPELPQDKLKAGAKVAEEFSKIDPALRGNQSVDGFIKNLSQEQLDKYIDEKVQARLAQAKGDKE